MRDGPPTLDPQSALGALDHGLDVRLASDDDEVGPAAWGGPGARGAYDLHSATGCARLTPTRAGVARRTDDRRTRGAAPLAVREPRFQPAQEDGGAGNI